MFVGCFDGNIVDHGEDASVVHVHGGGGHVCLVAPLEGRLDAAQPLDRSGCLDQCTSAGVGECAVDTVRERIELAVVDTRVDALSELASGGHRGAVDLDDVAHGGPSCVDVVGEAGVAEGLDGEGSVDRRRVRGFPDELDAVLCRTLDELQQVLLSQEVDRAGVEAVLGVLALGEADVVAGDGGEVVDCGANAAVLGLVEPLFFQSGALGVGGRAVGLAEVPSSDRRGLCRGAVLHSSAFEDG